MAPNKWEEDSDESTPPSSPPPVRRNKFKDEEEEEDDSDVLESWDADEDSEVEREKAKKAAEAKAKADAEAAANKKSKSQRIAEHQAANARRLAEEDSSDEEETDAEKRARLLKEQKAADLRHAEDLFGGAGTNSSTGRDKHITVSDPNDPTKAIDLTTLSLFDPKTKTQFETLRDTLGPLLGGNYKKPNYVMFLQEFTKIIAKDLKSDEIKKVSSALTTLSNEKMKEEKNAEKGGKKSKAAKTKTTLNASRDTSKTADTSAYDDFGDDDFM